MIYLTISIIRGKFKIARKNLFQQVEEPYDDKHISNYKDINNDLVKDKTKGKQMFYQKLVSSLSGQKTSHQSYNIKRLSHNIRVP